jgi:hypothetical protein
MSVRYQVDIVSKCCFAISFMMRGWCALGLRDERRFSLKLPGRLNFETKSLKPSCTAIVDVRTRGIAVVFQ